MPVPSDSIPEVFIVHGRDDLAKQSVARFVERFGFTATILHEQANGGRTVIEKLLDHSSRAKYAVIIVTPDDVGALKGDESSLQPRTRQNVVFEWGLFVGLLGARTFARFSKTIARCRPISQGLSISRWTGMTLGKRPLRKR